MRKRGGVRLDTNGEAGEETYGHRKNKRVNMEREGLELRDPKTSGRCETNKYKTRTHSLNDEQSQEESNKQRTDGQTLTACHALTGGSTQGETVRAASLLSRCPRATSSDFASRRYYNNKMSTKIKTGKIC